MSPSSEISSPLAMSVVTASNPPNHPITTTAKSSSPYSCNFCSKKFATSYGLAGHYNIHKNLPDNLWVKHGPQGSKIRKEILKAVEEGRSSSPRQRRTRILSPDQFRVSLPPRVNPISHPWWALGLINGYPEGRKPMVGLLGFRGMQNGRAHHAPGRLNPSISIQSAMDRPAVSPTNLSMSAAEAASKYTCNFCKKKFYKRHALSAHYVAHKKLPASKWVEHGPPGSKIRKAILKALEGVQSSSHRTPLTNRNSSDYPWWALGLTNVSSTSKELTVKVLGSRGWWNHQAYKSGPDGEVRVKEGVEASKDSTDACLGVKGDEKENVMPAAIRCKNPLPDLNEPTSPVMSP